MAALCGQVVMVAAVVAVLYSQGKAATPLVVLFVLINAMAGAMIPLLTRAGAETQEHLNYSRAAMEREAR